MKKYKSIKREQRSTTEKKGNIGRKRGSVIVEAAIFLPIFLVAVLTLGLFIRQVGVEETVFHAMLNQGRLVSVSAYSRAQIKPGSENGLGSRQLFGAGVQTQLGKELGLDSQSVKLNVFQYLYEQGGRDNLIEAAVSYETHIPLPRAVSDSMSGKKHMVLRAFLGSACENKVSSLEEMESEKESCIVYVFPKTGQRYHGAGCKTITSTPVKFVLSAKLKNKYKACSLCGAESIRSGCPVVCFTGYGAVYHRGNCRMVEKYVVSMERDIAVEKGYTPCRKCGGLD